MKKAASIFLRADIVQEDIRRLTLWLQNQRVTRFLNEDARVVDELNRLLADVPAPMLRYHMNQQGRFFLEHRLGALFCEAERYARQKGCTALRTAMGSEGFSLHGRPLGNIGQELQALSAPGRQDFHWLLSRGFRPVGIQPHALGRNFHCVLLTKEL